MKKVESNYYFRREYTQVPYQLVLNEIFSKRKQKKSAGDFTVLMFLKYIVL